MNTWSLFRHNAVEIDGSQITVIANYTEFTKLTIVIVSVQWENLVILEMENTADTIPLNQAVMAVMLWVLSTAVHLYVVPFP